MSHDNDQDDRKDPKSTEGTHEPYLRLSALGAKNGFSPRQMATFARDGLRVARPFLGRVAYSRQGWLDEFIATKVSRPKEIR